MLASLLVGSLSLLFVIITVMMILVILVQRPKGGGLSGAFGGAGGAAQTAFGARIGDVLTWTTVTFFVLFVLLAIGLTWTIKGEIRGTPQPVLEAPVQTTDTSAPVTPMDTTPIEQPDTTMPMPVVDEPALPQVPVTEQPVNPEN